MPGLFVLPVLPAHAVAVWQPVIRSHVLFSGIGYVLCLVAWLMLLLYWCGSFFYSLNGLQLLLSPFAFAVISMPAAVSLLPYSLFGIAALPPLLSLEKLMFQSILAGFVLLRVSAGGALLFSPEIFGKLLSFMRKSVFGVLSWLVCEHSVVTPHPPLARAHGGIVVHGGLCVFDDGLCGQSVCVAGVAVLGVDAWKVA